MAAVYPVSPTLAAADGPSAAGLYVLTVSVAATR
jgi:hypothetical protein